MTAGEPVVAYSSAESAPTDRSRRGYESERIPAHHGATERQVEFHEPTERSYPFASELSFQGSSQLFLTVLVRYRTLVGI